MCDKVSAWIHRRPAGCLGVRRSRRQNQGPRRTNARLAAYKRRDYMGQGMSNFEPLFDRWASRVRRRLALRHLLTGAALGAVLALVPAGIAWKMRHGKLRPYAA